MTGQVPCGLVTFGDQCTDTQCVKKSLGPFRVASESSRSGRGGARIRGEGEGKPRSFAPHVWLFQDWSYGPPGWMGGGLVRLQSLGLAPVLATRSNISYRLHQESMFTFNRLGCSLSFSTHRPWTAAYEGSFPLAESSTRSRSPNRSGCWFLLLLWLKCFPKETLKQT